MSEDMSEEMALLLLAEDATKTRGPKSDPTEPRIAAVWFKLVTSLASPCENPDCKDPRPTEDKGRLVTVLVKGKRMCRYCFYDGWLSNG